jgi:HEAT repeat protein
MASYLDCARAGTSDRRRIAVAGFRDIGPPAAEAALPYLREALESPHWDLRLMVVETLAKLGPSAEPLLRDATRDSNEEVRKRAVQALGE